jgi:hypothetical protein
MRENDELRVRVITGSATSETLNNRVDIRFIGETFIKNADMSFDNSFSTSEAFLDENKSMNGRRRRENRIKVNGNIVQNNASEIAPNSLKMK